MQASTNAQIQGGISAHTPAHHNQHVNRHYRSPGEFTCWAEGLPGGQEDYPLFRTYDPPLFAIAVLAAIYLLLG